MILSYILHGHIPYYNAHPPHPDPLLHAKLTKKASPLLDIDVHTLTEHFAASRLSYSTQALPVNVLLDTLIRPSVDVEDAECTTNVQWRCVPEKAVPHLVIGNAPQPGGQWVENPMPASWDIQTLSYAAMLSLPGYSYAQHYRSVTGVDLPAFTRPSRREITDYLCAYPQAVQIDNVFRNHETLADVSRTEHGFYIGSHGIHCKHLVLASGIFSEILQPLPMLNPLSPLEPVPEIPLLVIGSGFSAADVIISAPRDQKILHIFKWDPENRPSPLRGCHQQAYPEYAGVYRLMKRAAVAASSASTTERPKNRRATSSAFLESRAWDEVYEGQPNVEIAAVQMHSDDHATVTFRRLNDDTFTRQVRGLVYATGRRGTLGYLDRALRSEVLDLSLGPESENRIEANPFISAQSLRAKALESLEVARDVFIIGSLTGDSLLRFAYGGCVQTAGRLIRAYSGNNGVSGREDGGERLSNHSTRASSRDARALTVMNGIDGHNVYPLHDTEQAGSLDKDGNDNAIASMAEKVGLGEWGRSLMRLWG